MKQARNSRRFENGSVSINLMLDRIVRPTFHLGHQDRSAFRLFGFLGIISASLMTVLLAFNLDQSPALMSSIIVVSLLTFYVISKATLVVTHIESLTFYHHLIGIISIVTLMLWALNQPLLPYLDLTVLGIGLFLFWGRIGCLMVGCCHGRPHRLGVCYRPEHTKVGFMSYYVGIRLFPIQLVESLLALFLVAVGLFLILRNRNPGEALTWFIAAYAIGRFFIELQRGDAMRRYAQGFSEAQWISLILTLIVFVAGLAGILPLRPWSYAFSFLSVLFIVVALRRRYFVNARYLLLHPHHVEEIARYLEMLSRLTAADHEVVNTGKKVQVSTVQVVNTSMEVQLSASKIPSKDGSIDHIALSYRNQVMSKQAADILTDLILQLLTPARSSELREGTHPGVYHLLLFPQTG